MRKTIALLMGAAIMMPAAQAQTDAVQVDPADWPRYARDLGGTRYSPLDQINKNNVENLDQAWSYRLRPEGGAGLLGGTVPIVIDGIMYLPVGNAVVALEAHTGRQLWNHPVEGGLVRRGVTWWAGDGQQGAPVFYNSGGAVTALGAATGGKDGTLGQDGSIKLEGAPYGYPPTIFGNVMLIGASTAEMPRGPAGNSRAYDARTGEKLWEVDSGPQPGEVGHGTGLDDGWTARSGPNMWTWSTTADP